MSQKAENMKHVADACSYGIGAACVMEWLPPVAALLSIIWLGIQIFDYVKKKKWRNK